MINADNIRKLDYIRTKSGIYAQVTDVQDEVVVTDGGIFSYSDIDDYNKYINKLVVEGDFVNGSRVYKSKGNLLVNGNFVYNVNIVQIMSKRMFYQNCYIPNSHSRISNCVWVPIKQFPKYEVSSTGVIREIESGKILTYVSGKDTPYVRLDDIREKKVMSVAVLVLEAFSGPARGRVPNFRDMNKFNCNISNLEWTFSEEYIKEHKPKSNTNYKNRFLIGFFNEVPVIYADNVREAYEFMFDHCGDVTDTSSYKLTRAIRDGKPYHGITFGTVSEEEYYEYTKLIDLDNFKVMYEDKIRKKYKPLDESFNPNFKFLKEPNEKSYINMSFLGGPSDDEIFALEKEMSHKSVSLKEFKDNIYAAMSRYE